jgi:hypothetical protein
MSIFIVLLGTSFVKDPERRSHSLGARKKKEERRRRRREERKREGGRSLHPRGGRSLYPRGGRSLQAKRRPEPLPRVAGGQRQAWPRGRRRDR